MKVGIIGNGFVGQATKILGCLDTEIITYDIAPEKCNPLGTTLRSLCLCDLVFICVPTPMKLNGSCDTSIIEQCIADLQSSTNIGGPLIIIRSTVPPGTSERLGVNFMPEFLTEKDWYSDFTHCKDWIFGCLEKDRIKLMSLVTELINNAHRHARIKHKSVLFTGCSEAEMVKCLKNTFLATKVSFCNEMKEFCQKKGINYTTVKNYCLLDDRIGKSHMTVPGHDGKHGFSGTCLVKDINSLFFEMETSGINSYVVPAVIRRNEIVDRPEKDWMNNIGRSLNYTISGKVIIVTGGAGFIGQHLCKQLVSDKRNFVICLDNLNTGSRGNIEDLIKEKNFVFIEMDVIDIASIKVGEVSQIYHLACPASPPAYQLDPIYTIKTIVQGTTNVLEFAKQKNAKVLLASTSEVYGDPLISPQTEDYKGNVNPIGPRACYDESKRLAETLIFDYHRKHNVKICVARIFNTYGPGMSLEDGRVITNFISQVLANSDITVYGNGTQTRSFCYIDDQITGLMRLMKSKITGPVNIGNPNEELTMLQLAKKILVISGSTSRIVYKSLPIDDPKTRRPDITLARKHLDWNPVIDIETGLKEMINCYKCI